MTNGRLSVDFDITAFSCIFNVWTGAVPVSERLLNEFSQGQCRDIIPFLPHRKQNSRCWLRHSFCQCTNSPPHLQHPEMDVLFHGTPRDCSPCSNGEGLDGPLGDGGAVCVFIVDVMLRLEETECLVEV
ncbi:hypothetical protein JTB14_000205 [Gonioctena quinquepunctata]|nr:hypothetical protein JTB14_000205 [Gonioctena quinquepunctata]